MLPRCILANIVRGGRSHWRNTEKLVLARIGRWRAGDILGLCSVVVESENWLNHHRERGREVSSEILWVGNSRRVRHAVEDGQFRKQGCTVPVLRRVSLLPPRNFFPRCWKSTPRPAHSPSPLPHPPPQVRFPLMG